MRLSVRAGLAGVVAAGVAVGVAEMVAVLTGAQSAPLVAVGGVVVDHVPPAVKDLGVKLFGVHDKTALIVGTAILLAIYAVGLGVVAARHWRVGLVGVGLFAMIGVAAAMTRHDAGALASLPTLVGAGLAVVVLRYLLALAGADVAAAGAREPAPVGAKPMVTTGAEPPVADGPVSGDTKTGRAGTRADAYASANDGSRRRFLRALGIAAGVALVSGVAGRMLASRKTVTKARSEVVLPQPRSTAPPLSADVQAAGATPYVSANQDFYRIDTALVVPEVDPATWQLKIHGMVRNPITITWEQLLQRPMIERYITLACVSNEVGGDLIGNARWLGTPVKDLLDEADPLPGADQVVQRSADGWTCGSPTATLRDGRDALLAIGMNGETLPVDHGFPVRMVVPGLYGYVSACKWITEVELSRFSDFDAYWVPRGWAQQAPIKTESRIDTPRDGSGKSPGTVLVAGVAWAQHRGISKVEVQVDDEPWVVAQLHATASADTWREWSYPWQATAGQHTLRVRATDIGGETQTSTPAQPAPDGATGWHSVQVNVG